MNNVLEKLRKEKNLNQEELGLLLGVTRQTIISLEKGKYNPSLELAFKISLFFDKRIEEIFIFESEKGGVNNE